MKPEFEQVPDIITGKDLDYLSDMFDWNYEALKLANDCIENVQDIDIKTTLKDVYDLFNSNLNDALSILNRGGSNE